MIIIICRMRKWLPCIFTLPCIFNSWLKAVLDQIPRREGGGVVHNCKPSLTQSKERKVQRGTALTHARAAILPARGAPALQVPGAAKGAASRVAVRGAAPRAGSSLRDAALPTPPPPRGDALSALGALRPALQPAQGEKGRRKASGRHRSPRTCGEARKGPQRAPSCRL